MSTAASASHWRGGLARDGIHQVCCESGVLDILMHGSEQLLSRARPRLLLVAFNGAVANRGDKQAPFFSGKALAQELGLPLMAFSDPTLAGASDIGLAWYAGNYQMPGLSRDIASIIDSVATRFGVRPVLFGGSGGGFAVLQQMALLQSDPFGFAWNPQTSISDYVPDVVSLYLSTAFPHLRDRVEAGRSLELSERRKLLYGLLDEAGIIHDLRACPAALRGQLLYLQNADDWHVRKHAYTFLDPGPWTRLSRRAFGLPQGGACWFGSWGKGHAAPPRTMILQVLREIAAGVPARDIARALDDIEGVEAPYFSWSKCDGLVTGPEAAVRVEQGQVHVACKLSPVEKAHADAYEYAFYLMAGASRIDARWYRPDASAAFRLPQVDSPLSVKVFVRDALGSVRITRVPVPFVADP